MPIVNGINTALTRPCSFCKKHIMWAETIYHSKRYWGQLHKDCVEKYDKYKDAECALTGKEVPHGALSKVPDKEKPNPAPHTSPEVLRDQRPTLTLVPEMPRPNRETDSRQGDSGTRVLLGRVIPFPRKT